MKRILVALGVFLALALPAHAQKTKAQMTTEVNTNFPDNTVGSITPTILRATVIDLINSYLDLNGVTGTTGSIPFFSGTVLAQDNANLFWDNTAKALSIGSNTFTFGVNGEHLVATGSVASHWAARISNTNASGFSTLWLGANNEGFIRFGVSAGNKMSVVASVAGVPVTIATQGTDRVTVSDTGVTATGWLKIGITTVAGLPTCNAGQEATLMYVTDQNTAVAYRGAVTGGGTTRQLVLCSNSAWIQD